MRPIAPPRLRPGDRIGIIAPSSPIDRSAVAAGARILEGFGFRIVRGRHLGDRRGHLAGTDRARLDDLNRMLRDPDIRCVLLARGGYGAMRIADGVDWAAMRDDPKIFAGFSDATYLHVGFARFANVRTLHGPNVQGIGTGRGDARRFVEWVTSPRPSERVRRLPAGKRVAGPAGLVRGRLAGGNLVLLHHAAAAGLLEPLAGRILFFEEVNEPPHRMDGMLTALSAGGFLHGVRGVALGEFARCLPRPGGRQLPLATVLHDHLAPIGVPVWRGVPAGHGRRNRPLPLGARARLGGGALLFEEGLVS